jgi:MFS family permease
VISRRIPAPPSAVLSAASEPIATGFADPVGAQIVGSTIRWSSAPDLIRKVKRTANVREENGETVLELRAETEVGLPYISEPAGLLIRRSIRQGLEHMADVLAARALGATPPKAPRRPGWAPPDRMTAAQASSIVTVCAVLAITSYGGSLFTQTVHFVATSYGASDAQLGLVLAITRIGTLVGLVGSIFSDRKGRRLILLVSTFGLCLTTLLSAFAPSLFVFGAMQVLSRGFVNLAVVVGFIATTEEASEGSRAYMLAVASIASGVGFALGSLLLPIADLSGEAWRILFLVGGLGLFAVPGLVRRLPETRRYAALGTRVAAARAEELIDPIYGGRLAVVAAIGFLLALFAAPESQFMNRYLGEERGYSGLDILVLRALTQGAPALIGVWIGGRVAESSGRKPVAAPASLAMALAGALFFLTGGSLLWLMLLITTVAGAVAGPSLAAFNTELFPTEVRGRAGGILLIIAVLGSVLGLLLGGYLAEPLGGIGKAVALTAVGPLVAALLLIRLLPEARGRALDEISPPEV